MTTACNAWLSQNGLRAGLNGLSLMHGKPRIFAAFGKASRKTDPKDIKHC
jgi:hypothetical protein